MSQPRWPYVEMNLKKWEFFLTIHETCGAIMYLGRIWSKHGQWAHIHAITRMSQVSFFLHDLSNLFSIRIVFKHMYIVPLLACVCVVSPCIPLDWQSGTHQRGFIFLCFECGTHGGSQLPRHMNSKESNAQMEGNTHIYDHWDGMFQCTKLIKRLMIFRVPFYLEFPSCYTTKTP